VNQEVDILAHSCGLKNANAFSREHARIVDTADKSTPMDVLHPYPEGGLK